MAWSVDSAPSNSDDPETYEKVVEFKVPGSLDPGRYRGSNRYPCKDSDYYTLVNVTCVKGQCNLPPQMYTGTGFGKICSSISYGLVAPPNMNAELTCDAYLGESPGYQALYMGWHFVGPLGTKATLNLGLSALYLYNRY